LWHAFLRAVAESDRSFLRELALEDDLAHAGGALIGVGGREDLAMPPLLTPRSFIAPCAIFTPLTFDFVGDVVLVVDDDAANEGTTIERGAAEREDLRAERLGTVGEVINPSTFASTMLDLAFDSLVGSLSLV